jgi:hypothetical protein
MRWIVLKHHCFFSGGGGRIHTLFLEANAISEENLEALKNELVMKGVG